MKKGFLILTAILIGNLVYGQKTSVDITIHARVDTSKYEIKEILSLWTNYLNSTPDSIYNNPYWNEAEKKKYSDFDFTRSIIYLFPSTEILSYYTPTILSIEKEGENYAIRTLFNAEGFGDNHNNSNPWCITKLYAVNENNQWKLKNALPIQTQYWNKKTIGKITFIYPPEHKFNKSLAKKAHQFCDSVALKFGFPDWKPFDYYITKNGDELGKLLGFDFFFIGYTTGMGMNDRRILFSGFDSEWYPHEFVHLIVENKSRHSMIDEGFATWLGGAMEKTFEERAKILAEQLAKNDSISFDDILKKRWGWQYAAYYTTGAMLCQLAYDQGGLVEIKKLLAIPAEDDKLKQEIAKLFKIKLTDLDAFLRAEMGKHGKKE